MIAYQEKLITDGLKEKGEFIEPTSNVGGSKNIICLQKVNCKW